MAMITVRRSPSRALSVFEHTHTPLSLWDEVDRMMEELWEKPTRWFQSTLSFPMDMYEDKEGLVIRLELPGMSKDDIEVSLEKECLTIKAEKKQEVAPEGATYYTCERCFGQYTRTVYLPFPVDAEKVSTSFQNGVLEIRAVKAEEAKAKKIEIKAGS